MRLLESLMLAFALSREPYERETQSPPSLPDHFHLYTHQQCSQVPALTFEHPPAPAKVQGSCLWATGARPV